MYFIMNKNTKENKIAKGVLWTPLKSNFLHILIREIIKRNYQIINIITFTKYYYHT